MGKCCLEDMAMLKTVNLNSLMKYLFMIFFLTLFFPLGLIISESFPDINFCTLTKGMWGRA